MTSLHKFLTPVCVGSLLLLTACPPPSSEGTDTDSETETETESESDTDTTAGPTTGTMPTTTTNTTTNTTTEDPTTEDPTTETTDDPPTTTEDPAECGNGEVEEGEECDGGDDCTSNCTLNVCGDGEQLGDEACDDGENNGNYNFCNADCSGLGPSCGDGNLDEGDEDCDSDDPQSGCLASSCTFAKDCAEIQAEYELDEASSGPYTIRPELKPDEDVAVHCDMSGGWTYVKSGDLIADSSAAEATAHCADSFGLTLFYPESEAHLLSAIGVALNPEILPALELNIALSDPGYLDIMAIYPKVAGESCAGMALNNDACPEWAPPGDGPWWVTAESLSESQPGTNNCDGCSMLYEVDAEQMAVIGYESFNAGGNGASSNIFLCRAP